jgi:ribosome-associated toxin RatA of RatAB toxin-antitoxin module
MKKATQEALIEASPQDCFEAIADFDSYPDWQEAVKDCEVLSRHPDGRAERVRFEIDAKVKRITYTLDYTYDEPGEISWDFVEGDPKHVEGEFRFEDRGDGTTLASYTLRLEAGVWLPGPVAKVLRDQVMKRAVDDLKTRLEG